MAEQGHWDTAIIRALLALPVVVFIWKVIVWDKVLVLGSTDALTGDASRIHPTCVLTTVATWSGAIIHEFCKDLSLCSRGHSVRWDDEWFKVYCFADPAHAELFMQRFGGERFDPKQRGKGAHWARWNKPPPRVA